MKELKNKKVIKEKKMIQVLTDANFDQFLEENKNVPVMVKFQAPWCGPCNMSKPVVEYIANTYENEYKVAEINIDENPELVKRFDIMKIPTFYFFKNGEKVDEMKSGDIRRSTMENKLKSLL